MKKTFCFSLADHETLLDYLTELQRHAAEVAAHPQNWMPWNYRQTIDGVTDTTPLQTVP